MQNQGVADRQLAWLHDDVVRVFHFWIPCGAPRFVTVDSEANRASGDNIDLVLVVCEVDIVHGCLPSPSPGTQIGWFGNRDGSNLMPNSARHTMKY